MPDDQAELAPEQNGPLPQPVPAFQEQERREHAENPRANRLTETRNAEQQNPYPAQQAGANHLGGDIHGDRVNLTQIQNVNLTLGQVKNLRSRKGRKWGRVSEIAKNGEPVDPVIRRFGDVMNAAPPDIAFAENAPHGGVASKQDTTLPDTLEAIRVWYRSFNLVEQCFIQVVAVMCGAPESEVRKATSELYQPLLAELRRQAGQRPNAEDRFVEAQEIKLDEQLLVRTHCILRKVDGAMRVFWQDARANGASAFAEQVLSVIEQETPIGSKTGEGFLERLEGLPLKLGGESSWRVPRALGTLWFKANETQFVQIATDWLESEIVGDGWEWRIANLLDGAFEVECAALQAEDMSVSSSVILELVESWIGDAHMASQEAWRQRLSGVIAKTYALIGQRRLAPTLRGLDKLLEFPLEEREDSIISTFSDEIFINCVLSYATLARFGAVRDVLKNLVAKVKIFSYGRQDRLLRARNKWDYENRRRIALTLAFGVFCFLAAFSFRETEELTQGLYSRARNLGKDPRILENERERDIFLVGILSEQEQAWQEDLRALLCSMLIEDNIPLAFYLLRNWADGVLNERGSEALDVRNAYIGFVVSVIARAQEWHEHLQRAGYARYPVILRSKAELENWRRESQQAATPLPIGALARDILKAIEASVLR